MKLKTTATKEFTFDCAHMLSYHEGLCKNLHGHTYKLQVTISNTKQDLNDVMFSDPSIGGMVMDFKDLKGIVKESVIDEFDHATIIWDAPSANHPEHLLADWLQDTGSKTVHMEKRPTCENMAADIFAILKDELDPYGIVLEEIKLWETPTSFATVTRG